jgi:hypothetical protein
VILNKALYRCIESAKLWYHELAGTLKSIGFKPNPRDMCIFNKNVKDVQATGSLMMTSSNKQLVLELERTLLKKYGQFCTSSEKIVSYLGCTWDFHEKGIVKVSQTAMIQDLVTSREKFHKDRGTEFNGKPSPPAAPCLLNRTPDATLLDAADAKTFHTHVATALYLANRT